MTLREAYKLLEISKGITPEELRQVYKDMLSVWHPDRHASNERLQSRASEKTLLISQAYELVKKQLEKGGDPLSQEEPKPGGKRPRRSKRVSSMVRCKVCGAPNRVDNMRRDLVCGRCRKPLFDLGTNQGKTIRCEDPDCIGTLGFDGRCIICGLTLDESLKLRRYKERGPLARLFLGLDAKSAFFRVTATILLAALGLLVPWHSLWPGNPAEPSGYHQVAPAPPAPTARIIPRKNDPGRNYRQAVETLMAGAGNKQRALVREMQSDLVTLGYPAGHIDGIMGAQTLNAAVSFLHEFDISRDHLGRLTFADLAKLIRLNAEVTTLIPDWAQLRRSRPSLAEADAFGHTALP